VVIKYRAAADIVNRTLVQVINEIQPGKKAIDLCIAGDKLLEEALKPIFKDTKDKGISFPTCVSVNEIVGHYSPLPPDELTIKEGDVVKVDLGVQIDGYVAMAAHTVVASATPTMPTTDRKADLIAACHFAAEAAHRLLKPGKKNSDITAAIKKIAEIYKVSPMEGVLSHQIKRFIIDGNKSIINKETLDQKVEDFEFQENEVYCIDIVMSTGEGKSKEIESKTTVFKRAVDQNYLLKMKASRYVLNEINQRFPTFPFTLRALDDKKGKLGITEMLKHNLLHPYPVLFEKAGEFVAQIKFTAMILPSATDRITTHPAANVQSSLKIEDAEINAILAMGTKRTKKNKKKKVKKPKDPNAKKPEDKPTAMDTK